MPNPQLADLTNEITNATTVEDSATKLINGIADRINAAVQAALANGASQAEIQPVADLGTQLQAQSDALQAAVTANTPAA